MKATLRSLLKMLFFLLFGLTILWFLYRDLNASYLAECVSKGIPEAECSLVDKVIADFRATHIFWLIVICFCFFLSNVSRSLRWQQLIQSMGYNTKWANAFHCVMLGYFANLGLPRMGEVIRAATFTRYEVIPFEKVMGTVVVDRIIDLICLSLVFLLALLLQFDLLWQFIVDNANFSFSDVLFSPLFLIAFIALLILLILGWNYRSRLAGISFFQRLQRAASGFAEGLKSLRKVENKPRLILHSINIWLMYYLMTFLCFRAFDPTAHLGPLAGLLVFVFGSLGMIIPTPGGMGSYHALVIAALVLLGINQNDAFSFAMIIFFTINIFGNILFGIIALILLPNQNRNYQPVRV